MQFLWPSLLWSLVLVPLVLAFYILIQRRRRRFTLRYSSLVVVKAAVTSGHKLRRHIPPALFLLSLTAMLSALARPQTVVMLPTLEQTVILTIDVSGSMRTRDINPSRIEAAKSAALTFIQEQKANTRIGIVAFSGTAAIVQEPTIDREAALAAIERLYLQRSTAIGSGIVQSLNAIFGNVYSDTYGADILPTFPGSVPKSVPQGTYIPATIILLTDGANVQGPSPRLAAEKAADLGVRVFTIAVGSPSSGSSGASGRGQTNPGDPQNRGSQAFGGRFEVDEVTLKAIAETTGAEYFLATNANALKEIYQKLNSELILTPQKTEVTFYFTGAGALLSFFATALSILWFNRVP